MIKSFKGKEIEKIFDRIHLQKLLQDIQQIAYRKLRMLHNAQTLEDIRIPPNNRLQKLK